MWYPVPPFLPFARSANCIMSCNTRKRFSFVEYCAGHLLRKGRFRLGLLRTWSHIFSRFVVFSVSLYPHANRETKGSLPSKMLPSTNPTITSPTASHRTLNLGPCHCETGRSIHDIAFSALSVCFPLHAILVLPLLRRLSSSFSYFHLPSILAAWRHGTTCVQACNRVLSCSFALLPSSQVPPACRPWSVRFYRGAVLRP